MQVRIARFHNIYGPQGTWKGGREKAPAAFNRKAITAADHFEMWGDGKQTRSFTYIDDCVEVNFVCSCEYKRSILKSVCLCECRAFCVWWDLITGESIVPIITITIVNNFFFFFLNKKPRAAYLSILVLMKWSPWTNLLKSLLNVLERRWVDFVASICISSSCSENRLPSSKRNFQSSTFPDQKVSEDVIAKIRLLDKCWAGLLHFRSRTEWRRRLSGSKLKSKKKKREVSEQGNIRSLSKLTYMVNANKRSWRVCLCHEPSRSNLWSRGVCSKPCREG